MIALITQIINFNPRSPCGERQVDSMSDPYAWIISIHAPRAGSDGLACLYCRGRANISIHAPRAGSDRKHGMYATPTTIISIHAPRAGSDGYIRQFAIRSAISIHAPRAGSDPEARYSQSLSADISIHAPRAGSDFFLSLFLFFNYISIHAPRAGSDNSRFLRTRNCKISIHAPRAGSDLGAACHAPAGGNFNPRSPCGERRGAHSKTFALALFQSTLPVRGATNDPQQRKDFLAFQSTLPVRGATTTYR